MTMSMEILSIFLVTHMPMVSATTRISALESGPLLYVGNEPVRSRARFF